MSRAFFVAALACASSFAIADMSEIVERYHGEGKFAGVALVSKGENILFHKAYGPAEFVWETPLTPDAKFPICSLSEMFTAVLVLRQVEAGTMRLDQTVADYWPELAAEPTGSVKLDQLLRRVSGLAHTDSIDASVSPGIEVVPNDVAWFWRTRDPRIGSLQKTALLMLSRKPVSSPGFGRVNPTDYIVIGAMLEKATSKPYGELLQSEVLGPLGLKDTFLLNSTDLVPKLAGSTLRGVGGLHAGPAVRWENSPSGAGICSTATDLQRFALALMEGRLLKPETVSAMFAPNENWLSIAGTSLPVPFDGTNRDTVELIGALGAYRVQLTMLREEKIVVVLLSGTNDFNPKPVSRQANLPYELAAAALKG